MKVGAFDEVLGRNLDWVVISRGSLTMISRRPNLRELKAILMHCRCEQLNIKADLAPVFYVNAL
jgi:hypothetical protein